MDNQLCGEIGVATSVNTISCGNNIGTSIKVQLRGFGILSLCEVQVWGFTPTAITNANIATAVTAWATSPTTAATTYGDIADWDVSAVSNMYRLFYSKPTFNADISKWNVASVSNMQAMFGAFPF